MYHMEERDSIILAYRRDGLSIREIARRNGMSRKTVRKYLRAFEQAVGDNPDAEAMDTYLQQPVRYDSSKTCPQSDEPAGDGGDRRLHGPQPV